MARGRDSRDPDDGNNDETSLPFAKPILFFLHGGGQLIGL